MEQIGKVTVAVFQNIMMEMIVMTVLANLMVIAGQVIVDALLQTTQVMIVMTVTAYQMVITG